MEYTEQDVGRVREAMAAAFREHTGTPTGQNMWNMNMEKTWDIVAPAAVDALAGMLRDRTAQNVACADAYARGRDDGHADELASLEAAGRLLPADACTETVYGVRLSWDAGDRPDDYFAAGSRGEAEARYDAHMDRRRENAGWLVTPHLVQREETHGVGPWVPVEPEPDAWPCDHCGRPANAGVTFTDGRSYALCSTPCYGLVVEGGHPATALRPGRGPCPDCAPPADVTVARTRRPDYAGTRCRPGCACAGGLGYCDGGAE